MSERLEIAHLNATLEVSGELPETAWTHWLWNTDPEEPFDNDVRFNENQLMGMLVCRFKHASNTDDGNAHGMPDRLTIMDKSPEEMTWRELKDTVANLLLEWPKFLDRLHKNTNAAANLTQVVELITQCACRFGCLCALADDGTILDDAVETEPCHDEEYPDMRVLTSSSLRRMVGSLLIMYRHLHLLAVCKTLPSENSQPPITKYHYEASMDEFHLLCMHIALPVGARLNYRHDFKDMYNHVSQVIFFHNTQYKQQQRRPLQELQNAPAVHVLPAIRQIHPAIPIRYEEDHFDPSKSNGWYWLLMAGRVYLVTPEPLVLYSTDLIVLLRYYERHLESRPN